MIKMTIGRQVYCYLLAAVQLFNWYTILIGTKLTTELPLIPPQVLIAFCFYCYCIIINNGFNIINNVSLIITQYDTSVNQVKNNNKQSNFDNHADAGQSSAIAIQVSVISIEQLTQAVLQLEVKVTYYQCRFC